VEAYKIKGAKACAMEYSKNIGNDELVNYKVTYFIKQYGKCIPIGRAFFQVGDKATSGTITFDEKQKPADCLVDNDNIII
jgi:hypothetical protein